VAGRAETISQKAIRHFRQHLLSLCATEVQLSSFGIIGVLGATSKLFRVISIALRPQDQIFAEPLRYEAVHGQTPSLMYD
jgi:hypothetical protein